MPNFFNSHYNNKKQKIKIKYIINIHKILLIIY